MVEEIVKVHASEDMEREFSDLVGRCYQENPDKDDLKELRKYLEENPQLYRFVFDLSKQVRTSLIEKFIDQRAARMALYMNIKVMRLELGHKQAPMIEKILIDNVVTSWLRLQWVEFNMAAFVGREGASISTLEFWEKRLSASQRRYLRACETLARVRKITRATLQINIAEEGSQQLNVAGDLVTKGGSLSGK